MSFKSKCGKCGQKYKVEEDLIGKIIDCPSCGNQMLISPPRDSS